MLSLLTSAALRRILWLAAACFFTGMARSQTFTQIRDTGPRANRINVVFLGDGYTAAQQAKFQTDVARKLQAMLNDESWIRFADLINAFTIFVASNESGLDDFPAKINRDTYFGSYYDGRIVGTLGTNVYPLLTQHVPDYDAIVMLVNASGARGSGGAIATATTGDGSDDVLLHELGHSFAGLADEYIESALAVSPSAAVYPNAAPQYQRERVPWANFVSDSTLAPTPSPRNESPPEEKDVGVFQGSYYRNVGYWRPTYNSKMRSLGRPFGPVNLRAFDLAVHRLNLNLATALPAIVQPPAGAMVAIGQSYTLRVQATGAGPLTYQWRYNGRYIPAAIGDTYTVATGGPSTWGAYSVEVTNARGSTVSADALLLPPGTAVVPSVATLPPNATATIGETVSLAGPATGLGPLSFQWRKNGIIIAGATSSTLTLNNAQPADAGAYSVVVTNLAGAATSSVTSLAISAPPSRYSIVDLGMMARATAIEVTGLNNNGDVVGRCIFAPGVLAPTTITRAFIYSGGVMNELPPLPGDTSSSAYGINNLGRVVGNSDGGGASHGVVWADRVPAGIGTLNPAGPDSTIAFGINDAGQIVGVSQVRIGPLGTDRRAFLFSEGSMIDLGLPQGDPPGDPGGAANATALGINGTGLIIGESENRSDLDQPAGGWIYSGRAMTWMPRPANYPKSALRHINATGMVVGSMSPPNGANPLPPVRAFTYLAGALTFIDPLPGYRTAVAQGINSAGDVVGSCSNALIAPVGIAPFLYSAATTWDLRELVNLTGTNFTSLLQAIKINDRGQIVGLGQDAAGQPRAFLLTPTGSAFGLAANLITFPAIPDRAYGDAAPILNATASSGLPVSYSVLNGPATLIGDTLSIIGSGTITVQAMQAGNATTPAAVPIRRSFKVQPRAVTFTISDLAQVYDGGLHRVTVTAQPAVPFVVYYDGRTDAFAPSGAPADLAWQVYPWSVGGHEVRVLPASPNDSGIGAATLQIQPASIQVTLSDLAQPSGNGRGPTVTTNPSSIWSFSESTPRNGRPAPPTIALMFANQSTGGTSDVTAIVCDYGYSGSATAQFTIERAAQTINFPPIADRVFGAAPFVISATSSALQPVTFTVIGGPATISGDRVTLTGAGPVTIEASNAGNPSVLPAVARQTFTVAKATAAVILANLAQTADGSPKPISVTTIPAGLPLNVTYMGGANAPTTPGTYAVVATVNHANYAGTASDTLVISGANSPSVHPVAIIQPAAGIYRAGSALTFAVTFSGSIQLTGTPRLRLQIGGAARFTDRCVILDPESLGFVYTVVAGDSDSLTLGDRIDLNGGTITVDGQPVDVSFAQPELAGSAPFDFSTVRVDTSPPTQPPTIDPAVALGFNSGGSNYSLAIVAAGSPVQYSAVPPDGMQFASDTGVFFSTYSHWPSGTFPVRVSATNAAGTGSNQLRIVLVPTNQIVDIQALASSGDVGSVAVPENGTYRPGDTLTFAIRYNAGSFVFGTPRLALTIGSKVRYATYVPEFAPRTMVFRYIVATDDVDDDGIELPRTIDHPSSRMKGTEGSQLHPNWAFRTDTSGIRIGPANTGAIPAITSPLSALIAAGGSFSYTISASNSPGSFSALNLPAGLGFASPTISGSVAVAGTYSIVLGASNAMGSDSKTLVLTVAAPISVGGGGGAGGNGGTGGNTTSPPSGGGGGGGGFISLPQTIVFTPPGEVVMGSTLALSATASSGLPVTFSIVSGSGAVSGNVLMSSGVGSIVVRASQTGGGIYQSASTDVTIVAKNPAAITFNSPVSGFIINTPIPLSATSSAGQPIAFSLVSGTATLEGNVLTPTGPGQIVVRASSAGNNQFAAATTEVNFGNPQKAAQSINVAALKDASVTAGPFMLPTGSSAGLPVTYSVSGPARLSGNTVTLIGAAGTVSVRASAGGSDLYNPVEVVRTFNVRANGQQVYLGAIGSDPFAVAISADNTKGMFVTRLGSSGEAIAAKFRLNADGAFNVSATSLISGMVKDGVLTGSIAELGANFTADVQSPTGSTAALGGVYTASVPGSASGDACLVVGPNGEAYAVAVTRFAVTSGSGTITNAGEFSIVTSGGGRIAGSIDSTNGSMRGTFTSGANTVALVGLSEGEPRTDRLINLSSRLRVVSGDASRAMIAGFVVTGTQPKQMLVRAIGPMLGDFGVREALANPRLQIYNSAGALVAENEDWGSGADVSAVAERVGAFKLEANSRDAAIVAMLAPGAYTAQVIANGGSGVALIEIYDAAANPAAGSAPLVNLSTRGFVDAGDGNLIAGFVVSGNAPKRVLIRGIGPGLTQFALPGAAANPTLKLYAAGSPTPIAQNDDWTVPQPINTSQMAANAADITAASASAGAFPLAAGSKDAAIVIALLPGAYTAVVSSAADGTGAGLVEVYELSGR